MTRVPYTCPFCGRDSMLSGDDSRYGQVFLDIENAEGKHFAITGFSVCPNPKCRKFSMWVSLTEANPSSFTGDREVRGPTPKFPSKQHWRLVPWSSARVFPDYIPEQIRNDYAEACAIRDLSPKASATLARRCLQGMIRDFWKIRRNL